jgi:peptide methionine sulfoxide reductase msrA/msrB
MDKQALKAKLTPEEFSVVCENGTEPAFKNAYWSNHEAGIYVDIISGEPLFASVDKFDSGTGWPSFTKPIESSTVREKSDFSYGMDRVEVRSALSDAHLGHVFNDGPEPGGLRYCINSASLNFIPVAKMEDEGYGRLMYLFKKDKPAPKAETIYLAAGCFWGTEAYFQRLPGVISTRVGYSGGTKDNPTYEDVCTGKTGHAETMEVTFDPSRIPLQKILRHFWRMHDPTSLNRQGNDVGTQYRSAIFFTTPEQEKAVRASIAELSKGGRKIVTEVKAFTKFWKAEEYHQDYLVKNPGGYCHVDLSLADKE